LAGVDGYANQPLNKPVDVNAPAIRQALCGLLWEEIRPVRTLELTWPADAKRQPALEELAVTTLDAKCSASSWWNNLIAVKQAVKPTVSGNGRTYIYDLRKDTCGIVVSVVGKNASDYDMPTVRALTAATWKKMDVEIEWGLTRPPPRRTTAGESRPTTALRLEFTRSTATATLKQRTQVRGVPSAKVPPVVA